MLINLCIFLSITAVLLKAYLRTGKLTLLYQASLRQEIFNTFAPAARVSLLILYFYAVLHKLNHDFLNPEISCSTFLLDEVYRRFSLLPAPTWIHSYAVWGTLVIEAAIPLLLCFRRTRSTGILLGLGFHFFLALHPHRGLYSFSALMYALYFLFLPAGFTVTLQHTYKQIRKLHWQTFLPALKGLLISILPVMISITMLTLHLYSS